MLLLSPYTGTHQKTRTVTSWNGGVGKRINDVFGTWNSKHKRGTLLSKLTGNTLTPWYGRNFAHHWNCLASPWWLVKIGCWKLGTGHVSTVPFRIFMDFCSTPFIRPEDVASARHRTRPSWGKCEQHRTVTYLVCVLKKLVATSVVFADVLKVTNMTPTWPVRSQIIFKICQVSP